MELRTWISCKLRIFFWFLRCSLFTVSFHSTQIFFPQPVVDYSRRLRVTRKLRTAIASKVLHSLCGLCRVSDDQLLTVEGDLLGRTVCLYQVVGTELRLLDKLKMKSALSPQSDGRGTVYLPVFCVGIVVIWVKDKTRLELTETLTGGGMIQMALDVTVVDEGTLCVTVGSRRQGVYLVNIQDDSVTSVLKVPPNMGIRTPKGAAAMSGSILVAYHGSNVLALYRIGVASPEVCYPKGVKSVEGVIACPHDGQFLLLDKESNRIWILSASAEVVDGVAVAAPRHISRIDGDNEVYVSSGRSGTILALSPQ